MIIRYGFVSNSSSSSFLVICKGDLTDALSRAYATLFDIEPETDNLANRFLAELSETVIENLVAQSIAIDKPEEVQRYFHQSPQNAELLQKRAEAGHTFYVLDIPDSGDGGNQIQTALRNALKTTNAIDVTILDENDL